MFGILIAPVLILSAASDACAQAPAPDFYVGMCKESTTMPKPYGEWDLRGNPKRDDYCGCFATAFAARATATAKAQARESGAKPTPLAQSQKEELDLRNVCRAKVGLPLAVKSGSTK